MSRRLWLLAAICLTASIGTVLILSGGVIAQAWAATAPAPRSVELPLWGGTTATDYLAATEQNLQYPDFNMAIDSDFTNLLAPWSDEPQQWGAMDPPDPDNPPSTTAPQYTFTEDKNTVVGTSGDTVTATLTIAQSPTSGHTTNLQVVSANLIGSNDFFGQTVASVPYSCSGQVCSFTWKNPNLGAQYAGELTMKVTVTSNDYPGNWIVYKHFYSSPTMVGKFNGAFTDSMVNGSLVINAGVTMFATQQSACNVSGNLYAVNDSATANGTPLQHYEQTVLIDPTTTSIPFTFFGKIFTDYGDAGTFSLQDLKVQCLNIPYPAAWYMDPDAHDAEIQNWAANNPSAPEASYTYFANYNSSSTTANHPASDFSNAPYQTAQQTDAMLPDLVAQANEEAAGTSGTYTTTTLANGDTVNIDSARLTPVLIFVHGRRNPETCPDTPISTDQVYHPEEYGMIFIDQCQLWPYLPDRTKNETNAFEVFVQWDSWCKGFDSKAPGGNCKSLKNGHAWGGSYAVETTIRTWCTQRMMCHIICHSAGCAATEDAIANMVHKRTWNRYNVANIIEAASAAGGSELANHGRWLPTDSTWDAHQRAAIDDSLTTSHARQHSYNHDKVRVQARFIGSTLYDYHNFGIGLPLFPYIGMDVLDSGTVVNQGCIFQPGPSQVRCNDNDVALHSTCAHRLPIAYQYCNTTFKGIYPDGGTYSKNTFAYHGFWLDDNEFPHNSGGTIYTVGPFSQEGADKINTYNPYPEYKGCANAGQSCTFFNNYQVDHGGARNLADIEYAACHETLGLEKLANQQAWLCP